MNENNVIIYVGGADFTQVCVGLNRFPANSPIRRNCFNIAITNDIVYEIDESFTLVLRQDPFPPPSSRIRIRPNNTTVTILDESGMYWPKTKLSLAEAMSYFSCMQRSLLVSSMHLTLLMKVMDVLLSHSE